MKPVWNNTPHHTTWTTTKFTLFSTKVGPVLSISHGMGVPSLGILLHEITKLMYHARCKDPVFIRIGTCGGIGIDGGTVVISEDAVDGQLRSVYEIVSDKSWRRGLWVQINQNFVFQPILGKIVERPAILDKRIVREIKLLADPEDPYDTVVGKTMCTNDFYEGQGRLDGAFCDYTEQDKMEYLNKLCDFGVVNIEMECTVFAALTHHAGIKAAIVCVALLDRLKGDQVGGWLTLLINSLGILWFKYPWVTAVPELLHPLLHFSPDSHIGQLTKGSDERMAATSPDFGFTFHS